MKWQNIALPIAQGLDTKTDPKALPPTKLANLENGVFTKGGSIVKRNGYSKLSDKILSSSVAITGTRGLHSVDDELFMADSERITSYVPAEDKWIDRGRFKSPKISTETIDDIDDAQGAADCATLNNVTVYAWEKNVNASDSTTEGVFITIANEETGAVYLSNAVVRASAYKPRVVAAGDHIHVYFYESGTLYRLLIAPSNVERVITETPISLHSALITDFHSSNCRYDITTDGSNVYIAYLTSDGTDKLKVSKFTSSGVFVNDQDYAEDCGNCVAITVEPNTGKLGLSYHGSSTSLLRCLVADSVTLQSLHVRTVDSAQQTIINVAGEFKRDAQARQRIYVLDLNSADSQYAYPKTPSTGGDPLSIREDCTIEAWIKFETLPTGGASMCIVSRDGNATDKKGYYLRFTEAVTDKLQYLFRDEDGNLETVEWNWNSPTLDTWYHVAVSHDRNPGRAIFYLNGVSQGTESGLDTTTAEKSAAEFRIGSHNTASAEYFNGMISNVRIWKTARTVAEVLANYRKEITGVDTDLVGAWRFNDNYEDSSASSMHLIPIAPTIPVFVDGITARFPTTSFVAAETETIADDYPLIIFYEVHVTNDYEHYVKKASVTVWETVSDGVVWKRHSGIASRAWSDENDIHINLVHASALQTTFFTYMDEGTLIAKMEPGVARGIVVERVLPNVQDFGSGMYQWVGVFRKRIDTTAADPGATTLTANAVFSAMGMKRFTMDYQSLESHEATQVARTAYLNGGQVWQYDGVKPVECGFHTFPENFTASLLSVASPQLDIAEYWYKVYAVWTNANGEKERSTVAAPISITTTAPGHPLPDNRKVRITIQTIQNTNKNIHFEVYRTEGGAAAGLPYYRVSGNDPSLTGINGYIDNNQSVDTVTFDDDMPDTNLFLGEVDYTNSGELENVSPPAASIITEGKDRVWLAGFEDTSEIRYSKIHFTNQAVNFNDGLKLTVPEDGGAITGLRVISNSLVIFKESSIYVMPGDGPNNLGFGQFGSPQLVTNDVGCKSQRSIVDTPRGVMFQSSKGIYIITKQFQVGYIGAEVESYNANTVTRASLASDRNHVVFLYSDGRALLYDYFFKQWSTFTNHQGTAATFWKNLYCYGSSDGIVRKETPGSYNDMGARVQLRMETAWISLNTLQGFQRVRRAMVLGEFKSSHRLAMDVAYNYEPLKRRLTFDAGAKIGTTTFGDPAAPAFLGDGTPFGSGTTTTEMESTVYQFRAHLPVQKCQAIKFYFEDIASVGSYLAGGYEITELMLEVGTKRGVFKVADTRSI